VAELNVGCNASTLILVNCQDRGTQLGRLLAIQLASYPVSAPTGGFSFTFDAKARAFLKAASSFGPSFAERPLTNGRSTLSTGFSVQHTRFDTLDGIDLGSILGSSVAVNGRLLSRSTISLQVSADVASWFASFGLTDRIDIGVTVPYKRVELVGQTKTLVPECAFADGINSPGPCVIVNFVPPLRRMATGVGDIATRMKYQWLNRDRLHAGVTLDVAFPTGREEDFLGTGKVTAKAALLVSARSDVASPHVNIGYTAGGNSLRSFQSGSIPGFTERSREIDVAAGVDVAVGPRFTMTADVLARRLLDIGRLERFTGTAVNALGAVFESQADVITGSDLDVSFVNLGFKINPVRTYLVKIDVLVPVTRNGLQGRWTPVLGFDYTF
jgi:hypothetical protein